MKKETKVPANIISGSTADSVDEYPDQIGHIYQRIQNLFSSEKPFTNPGLSIATLVELLHTNQNYISRAINECSGMNFYHFLNKYRTGEARRLIEENRNYGLSLEKIMYKSGFRSRSVFIGAFKKYTGMTPGQFLKFSRKNRKGLQRSMPLS